MILRRDGITHYLFSFTSQAAKTMFGHATGEKYVPLDFTFELFTHVTYFFGFKVTAVYHLISDLIHYVPPRLTCPMISFVL